jgi:hypothetical protein
MERTEIATNISGIKPCEARRFVGELVPTALLVLAWLIISFLIFSLVDPYGVIGWPQIAGFNAVKPLQSANSRIYKPFALLKGDYNGIVLGASRELRGIEPMSPLLVGTGYRLYNFGVVDERPYEAEEIAKFAVNRMAIKTVIFDAEFTGYDADPFSAIGYPGPFYPKDSILRWAINQYFRAAMSPRGLEDSYTTVIASLQRQRVIRHTPEGREVFPPEPPPDVPYDYRGAFNATLARYLNELLPALAPQRELWISQGFDHTPLRKMVELAASHGIRFIAFVAADHALEMEALRRRGLWPLFEQWKRELVCVFHNAAAAHPNADVTLWDFSGYNSITTQPVPRSDAPSVVMDYLDPVHYAPNLGDKILSTILGLTEDTRVENDFGVKLTISNIDEHLAKIRNAQTRYESSHPEEMKWLASLDRSSPPPATSQTRPGRLDCDARE